MFQNLHNDFVISLKRSEHLTVNRKVCLLIHPLATAPITTGTPGPFSVVSEADIKHLPVLLPPTVCPCSELLPGQTRKFSLVNAIRPHSYAPPPRDMEAEAMLTAGTIYPLSPTGSLMLTAGSRCHLSRATLLSQVPEPPTLIGSRTQWRLQIRQQREQPRSQSRAGAGVWRLGGPASASCAQTGLLAVNIAITVPFVQI